mmetsp:Transcript_36325/g.51375  ORF Transcript_36325/g.51375 Transcript_36325/m.51375 type:complete len:429 (-) Transcript_36325:477-1763(-)
MPKLIEANPYERYKARRVILQTPLRAKVVVERRDARAHRYIMVIAPTSINGKHNKVIEGIEKLMSLSHPNLASVFEAYLWDGYCYWLMDNWMNACKRGLGFDSMSNEEKAAIVMRFVSTVHYMHVNNFFHGNLAWKDISFHRSTGDLDFLITDLGMGRYVNEERYALQESVEMLYGQPPEAEKGEFNPKGDVWTIGAITYRILTGDMREARLHTRSDYEATLKKYASDEARDFIDGCMHVSLEKRFSTTDALQHPWFDCIESDPSVLRHNHVLTTLRENADNDCAFKRLASASIAKHCDAKDLYEHREAFEAFDVTGKGYITHDEWMKTMRSQSFKQEDAVSLYHQIDRDASGVIDYNAFLSATIQYKRNVDISKLEEAFLNIDTNADGKITGSDLVHHFDVNLQEAKEILRGVHNCDEIDEPSSKLY